MKAFKGSQPFYGAVGELLHCAARSPHNGPATVKREPLYQPYATLLKAKELGDLILKQETWT